MRSPHPFSWVLRGLASRTKASVGPRRPRWVSTCANDTRALWRTNIEQKLLLEDPYLFLLLMVLKAFKSPCEKSGLCLNMYSYAYWAVCRCIHMVELCQCLTFVMRFAFNPKTYPPNEHLLCRNCWRTSGCQLASQLPRLPG